MSFLARVMGIVGAVMATLYLSGSKYVILNPTGTVAKMESNLIIISTVIMLVVVIPVMIAVVMLAWKYRASNQEAEYAPDWCHSRKIEAYMWGVPLVVVAILGVITAYYALKFDPFRRLPIATSKPPLTVQVVSLDWKWLFIYPEQGVAAVNQLYIPDDREIKFELTSQSNINAFWIPSLGTMIYAMPGMRSKVHLIADHPGVFEGRSANYSGAGFASMTFKTHAVSDADFEQWIQKVRQSNQSLNSQTYQTLAQPSENHMIEYYSHVMPGLFYRAANRCVQAGETCIETNVVDAASKTLWGALCAGSGFTPVKGSAWGARAVLAIPNKNTIVSETH